MSELQRFHGETLPHFDELGAMARRLVRRADLAEDLVQETYLRALAAQARYRPGTNARAWLHRILRNTACSIYRREARDVRLAERYERETAGSVEETTPTTPTFELAVLSLPDPFRQVVRLVDFEGMGYNDAAQRLGVPVGTVMSRLHRARRRLRRDLERAA